MSANLKVFRSSITATPDVGEKNTMESMTVPNQAMSVEEILRRFASGTLGDVYSEPEYSEDMPDLRGMDYVEREELKRANAENILDLKEKVKKPRKQKSLVPEAELVVESEKTEE